MTADNVAYIAIGVFTQKYSYNIEEFRVHYAEHVYIAYQLKDFSSKESDDLIKSFISVLPPVWKI